MLNQDVARAAAKRIEEEVRRRPPGTALTDIVESVKREFVASGVVAHIDDFADMPLPDDLSESSH